MRVADATAFSDSSTEQRAKKARLHQGGAVDVQTPRRANNSLLRSVFPKAEDQTDLALNL